MEIVDIQNRNTEISEFLDPADSRAYEQHPFLVRY